jgi:hypothetical protein
MWWSWSARRGGTAAHARGDAGRPHTPARATGWFAKPCGTGAAAGYLTEPASMPLTKNRWKARNTASGIASDKNDAGAISSMFEPNWRVWEKIATVNGCVSRPNVNATIRSFQVHRNWKIANDAIAGKPRGRISRVKIRPSDAPPSRADSRMSLGIPMKKRQVVQLGEAIDRSGCGCGRRVVIAACRSAASRSGRQRAHDQSRRLRHRPSRQAACG